MAHRPHRGRGYLRLLRHTVKRPIGAVGQIKVVGVQKYKSGVRVSIPAAAARWLTKTQCPIRPKPLVTRFPCRREELSGAVERMLGERDRLRDRTTRWACAFSIRWRSGKTRSASWLATRCPPRTRAKAGRLKRRRLLIPARRAGAALSSETEDVRPMTKAPLRGVRQQAAGRRT